MLPPTPIRRLLLVPLVVVIAAALAALTPAVALLTVAFNLISRRARPATSPPCWPMAGNIRSAPI